MTPSGVIFHGMEIGTTATPSLLVTRLSQALNVRVCRSLWPLLRLRPHFDRAVVKVKGRLSIWDLSFSLKTFLYPHWTYSTCPPLDIFGRLRTMAGVLEIDPLVVLPSVSGRVKRVDG